ncbi:MAG TPA: DUF1254 domain-containing protein [Afifellaceae bacterium]|nr:DUF1254 domain-containing protein [Afifellaceae bacterium]
MSAGALSRGRLSHAVGRFVGASVVLVLTILLVAGIVHIVTIFLVPQYVPADGWTRLARLSAAERFTVLEDEERQRPVIPGLDPLFVHAACQLDLAEAPAHLTLRAPDRFWSLALFNRRGIIVFSLNDRTATAGELHMLVVTAAHNAQLKESPPEGIEDTIVVESDATDLVALVRLYAPTNGSRRAARQIAAEAACAAFPLALEAAEP